MNRRTPADDPESNDSGGPLFAPHNGTRTSVAAADAIEPVSARTRRAVLEFILAQPQGCTRQEIEEGLGMDGSTVRPRCWELLGNGGHPTRIIETGELRLTRSGRKAEVLFGLVSGTAAHLGGT